MLDGNIPTRERMTNDDLTPAEPIDWSTFWAEAEEERRRSAHVGQFGKAALLNRFFDEKFVPQSMASFGCGPASCPFKIAKHYPEMEVHGYDSSEYIINKNRIRARKAELENIEFFTEQLPDVETKQMYDIVYCYAALHYVRDIEAALQALYERVAEGGFLIFNYPNTLTRSKYQRDLDSEASRKRFALVLAGENLLSYRSIRNILGSEPRSYWSLVDAPDVPWVGRSNPCVYVKK